MILLAEYWGGAARTTSDTFLCQALSFRNSISKACFGAFGFASLGCFLLLPLDFFLGRIHGGVKKVPEKIGEFPLDMSKNVFGVVYG